MIALFARYVKFENQMFMFQMLLAVLETMPFRPVSIQENKYRIGLFPSCIIHTTRPKKVENTLTLYHPGCGSQVQTGTEN